MFPASSPLGKMVAAATSSTDPKEPKLVKSSRIGVYAMKPNVSMAPVVPSLDVGSVKKIPLRRPDSFCSVFSHVDGT